MLAVGSIVIRVADLQKQVKFWTAALNYNVRYSDGGDFALLYPRGGVRPNVSLDVVRSVSVRPQR